MEDRAALAPTNISVLKVAAQVVGIIGCPIPISRRLVRHRDRHVPMQFRRGGKVRSCGPSGPKLHKLCLFPSASKIIRSSHFLSCMRRGLDDASLKRQWDETELKLKDFLSANVRRPIVLYLGTFPTAHSQGIRLNSS